MKRILRFVGAFVLVALVSFGLGWYLEHAKRSAAEDARARCQTSLDGAASASSRSQGLVDLYRARVEVLRANFGNASDSLAKAKTAFGASDPANAAIDRAVAAVKAQDAAAGDRLQEAINAAEAPAH